MGTTAENMAAMQAKYRPPKAAIPTSRGSASQASSALMNRGLADYAANRQTFNANQAQQNQAIQTAYDTNKGMIDADRAYYDQTFKPMEQRLASISNPGQEQYAKAYSTANADVAQSFGAQRSMLSRDMSRYGVSPDSGKFLAAMGGLGVQEALAQAQGRAGAAQAVQGRADSALTQGLQLGQTHRNTQQLAAPQFANATYDMPGSLASLALGQDELKLKESQAALDRNQDWAKAVLAEGGAEYLALRDERNAKERQTQGMRAPQWSTGVSMYQGNRI